MKSLLRHLLRPMRPLRSSSIVWVSLLLLSTAPVMGARAAEQRCEDVFQAESIPTAKLGSRVRFSAMKLGNIETGENSRIEAYNAIDGRGQFYLFSETLPAGKKPETSVLPIIAFSRYFEQFEIYARATAPDSSGVILYQTMFPSVERLNRLSTNGVQFEDVSLLRPQIYSERYFQNRALRRKIPLASRGPFFAHDRLDTHMIASLSLPRWLVDAYFHYVEFESALEKQPIMISLKKNREVAEHLSRLFPVGLIWDQMTNSFTSVLSLNSEPGRNTKTFVDEIQAHLRKYADRLIVGSRSRIAQESIYILERIPSFQARISTEFDSLVTNQKLRGLTRELSDDFLREEAIRIVSELTQTSRAEIRAKIESETSHTSEAIMQTPKPEVKP